MDLVVVGSKPTRHPILSSACARSFARMRGMTKHAPVAQLDRASDFESAGRTFESCQTQLVNNFRLLTKEKCSGTFFNVAKMQQGPLAQLVEQQTLNLWVASSNLAWLKKLI